MPIGGEKPREDRSMKIAIMMRAMDQDSGFRGYTEGLVENMLRIGSENSYLLLYRTTKWFGHFSSYKNAKEILLRAPHKFAWDQVVVPYRAWRERADIIFNPKFSVPLVSHCPVTMGLQEPSWWVWPEHHETWDVRYMRTMLPVYCRKATHFFPMLGFVLEENRKYLRLPLDNATVTYSAPDKSFVPVEDPDVLNEFRNKYQLPQKFILGLPRVDHPGLDNSTSFFPGKNPETTVRAFALCRKEIPHKLVLAGDRVREYLLYRGLNEADLEGIHFLGFVPYQEQPKLFSLAELLVTPAWYEGFPHLIMHAMVCGCPVIASQTGGAPEVSGGATLLADPNDPANFAAKILAVINNQKLREELKCKGLQRAATFTWERTARLTLDGLMQAVNGSQSAKKLSKIVSSHE
jgi:glycosyltransferase involved in cell wall biosynthesis